MQVKEELESIGCQIKTFSAVQSVLKHEDGIFFLVLKLLLIMNIEFFVNRCVLSVKEREGKKNYHTIACSVESYLIA